MAADLLRPDGAVIKWLESNKDVMSLIGGIMSIIQPDLYELGRKAFAKLAEDPDLVTTPADSLFRALKVWAAPFNAMTVVSNRTTPLHRDTGSRAAWSDLLLALGQYEDGRLLLPPLGIVYRYNPGTIVCFSGTAFEHGATCVGNRACVVFYMKDNVMNRLGLPIATWANVDGYAILPEPGNADESWMFYEPYEPHLAPLA